jgi:ABC-type sugar transport system ATPase subunit
MTAIRVEDVSLEFRTAGARRPSDTGLDSFGALFARMGMAPENRSYYAEMSRRMAQNVPGGVALRHLSVEAHAGETLALVGPSGCGKTTLLKVIAGLQAPDAGRVFFDDRDVTHLPPGARGIGMVFQSYALFPHLKSRDNVSFFYWVHRRQAEIPARVRAVSEMMGLDFATLLDRKPPKLSGGQQQRVAIARCIAREPSAFLFDEPLSHLDAKLRMQLRAEIKRLLHRFSVTSLYVTHDQTEAIALGDRIGIMREGRMEQVGSYAEIYGRPMPSSPASSARRP